MEANEQLGTELGSKYYNELKEKENKVLNEQRQATDKYNNLLSELEQDLGRTLDKYEKTFFLIEDYSVLTELSEADEDYFINSFKSVREVFPAVISVYVTSLGKVLIIASEEKSSSKRTVLLYNEVQLQHL